MDKFLCVHCGGTIFENDPMLSEELGEIIWSHSEDYGCDDPKPFCRHSHYRDEHCAEMDCWNYFSKCLRHAVNNPNNPCTHEKAKVA